MLAKRAFSLRLIRNCSSAVLYHKNKRQFSNKPNKNQDQDPNNDPNLPLGNLGSKYRLFRDEESKEILDIIEAPYKYEEFIQEEPETHDPFEGLNLERGVTGVFEIEDLLRVLQRDNAEDLFVAAVPPEMSYVDYICIVTGKSQRHMLAMAQFVRKVYKQKKHKTDLVPRLEGEDSKEWIALDLGNIALHIFSKEARRKYNLESLWALGPEYDPELNKKDPVVELLEKHSVYLKDLEPAS